MILTKKIPNRSWRSAFAAYLAFNAHITQVSRVLTPAVLYQYRPPQIHTHKTETQSWTADPP
jgi:hypothetical protein